MGSQGGSWPVPGTSPRTEQVHPWQTACVSLIPGNRVSESPGLGLLGCSAPRIPPQPLTSYGASPAFAPLLPCTPLSSLGAVAMLDPPPGKPTHSTPGAATHPGSHSCPFQPGVTPELLALPPHPCAQWVCIAVDCPPDGLLPRSAFPQSCNVVKFSPVVIVFLITAQPRGRVGTQSLTPPWPLALSLV